MSENTKPQIQRSYGFPNVHLWMILPLLIATTGFYFTYWSVFADVPFHQHLHGLSATLWFVLLVLQPLLQKHNNRVLHRKIGFIGLFLAGAVVFSALQVVQNNLINDALQPVLRYGLTWGDFLFLLGFSHAVLMAMWRSKSKAVHARYMIASAIWALLPALSRLIYFPIMIAYGYPPPLRFLTVVYLSVGLILATVGIMMAIDYRRESRIYAGYSLVAGGILLFGVSVDYMGRAPWWIAFCDHLLA